VADDLVIPVTGAGTATPTIATDDVAGRHFQRVKLDVGADGATSLWVGSDTVSTATLANVAGSASSVTLLASNTARKGAYVFNDSTATLYLKYGSAASTTSYVVQVPPGAFWEMPNRPIYTGLIAGIWSAANGNARVTEV
jgi:hypothetical protein